MIKILALGIPCRRLSGCKGTEFLIKGKIKYDLFCLWISLEKKKKKLIVVGKSKENPIFRRI